ncbi:LOW QUALITY PROTEIN: probable tRNA(His) guanylyltransferase [Clytia hemisphaerica]|uniref:LOW QUALITY PROTEIN: probable tRNA(His) guanylyltransferase n=1 Tax=Clytia hemisphaerica TaxID=252671 RepID=UPI0034D48AD0
MAKSKFEYVKKFEENDVCLPNCWIVVRIDGRSFHRFSEDHCYSKPNDVRGLSLMNKCAEEVMQQFHDITISYGESDEYSFIFKRKTTQFSRRKSKLMTNIVSLFSSCFVFHWQKFFPDTKLQYPPMFDSRVAVYPALENIRDYLNWRQADCHINNLYNTCFWTLVNRGGLTTTEAEKKLKGTLSGDKNEMLFSEFGINYNEEPDSFKKGSVLIRELYEDEVVKKTKDGELTNETTKRTRSKVVLLHQDIIGNSFWKQHPNIL